MRNPIKPYLAQDAIPLNHDPAHAAIRLGIGTTRLYELLGTKEIRSIKLGTRTLIPEAELQRWIQVRLKGQGG